jgi:hypothetical protein
MRDDDVKLIWEAWSGDTRAVELHGELIDAVWSDSHDRAEKLYGELKPLIQGTTSSVDLLKDIGIEIDEGRDDDGDRYWETWEIRAITSEAMKKWGTHVIDWEFQDERDKVEIADIVLRSLIQRGQPVIFTGYKS